MQLPRRLRRHHQVRKLLQDVSLTVDDLVLPLFVKADIDTKVPIASMPGHYQLSLKDLTTELAEIQQLGIKSILLFGIPSYKDTSGSAALQEDGIIQQALRLCKKAAPNVLTIADLCFCEYTDHGHCGVLDNAYEVDNALTLELLAEQAISLAAAGADIIAPSASMDNMVASIRQKLDASGYEKTPILSYAIKYNSALYGPFRHAAEGAPQHGDRSGYQMDYANKHQSLLEAQLDINQGADMLMVKPGLFYLDIIHQIKNAFPAYPLAAYQVSGEFSMIKAAAAEGWLDHDSTVMESLVAFKRAGADFIISYFTKDVAVQLQK